jgi:hypothetical protein
MTLLQVFGPFRKGSISLKDCIQVVKWLITCRSAPAWQNQVSLPVAPLENPQLSVFWL